MRGIWENFTYYPTENYYKDGIFCAYDYDTDVDCIEKMKFIYDNRNQITWVNTKAGGIQKNRYDGEGLRAELEENGRLVRFLFHNGEVVLEEPTEGAVTRYIRGYDLISSDSAAAKTYYHYTSDNLGSITHVTDEDGNICNQYEYDAFGSFTTKEETIPNRFCYTGEQYDPITSQYYLRARFYNPVIGRFLNEDTYYGDGLNLYTYCHNNPVNFVDPSGHTCIQKYRNKLRRLGLSKREANWFINNARGAKGNDRKEYLAEKLMDRIMERKGYEKLPSKLQSNNGIDGIYVKRGSQIVLIMGESKFGKSPLRQTVTMGKQMSDEWIMKNVNNMTKSVNGVKKAGDYLNNYLKSGGIYHAVIIRIRGTGYVRVRYRTERNPGSPANKGFPVYTDWK